jgi:hypothetical protein
MSNNITNDSVLELPFRIGNQDWDELPTDIQEHLWDGWCAVRKMAARSRIDDLMDHLALRKFQTLGNHEKAVIETLTRDWEAMPIHRIKPPCGAR